MAKKEGEELMNSKNILFPVDMLFKIVDLLSYWDITQYDYAIQCDYDDVFESITKKLRATELRKAYSKIVTANDGDDRFFARMEYLKLRYENHGDLSVLR